MPPSRKTRRQAERRGRWAERYGAVFLVLKGYSIVAMRYKSPIGEIDIVARRGNVLAFVEVKARKHYENAIEAVTPTARRRIAQSAALFLSRHKRLSGHDVRYDIIAISGLRICHLRDAWRDGGF